MRVQGIGISAGPPMDNGDLIILEKYLNIFQEIGFDYVELSANGLDMIINGKLNYEQLRNLKRLLSKFDLKYTVHSPDYLNLMAVKQQEKHKEVFESVIKFSGEIGAEVMVYHSSAASLNEENMNLYYRKKYKNMDKKKLFEILVSEESEYLHGIADYMSEMGIKLAIENMFYSDDSECYTYGFHPEELVSHIEKINKKNVGIAFDFGHAYISAKKYNFNFMETLRCVEPYLMHIHAHDNFGIYGGGNNDTYIHRLPLGIGDLHMPIGLGEIPYREIIQIIDRYSGIFVLELKPRYFTHLEKVYKETKELLKQ